MIVSPGSADSLWIPVVGNDVVVVGKLFLADCADPSLLPDFAVQQFPHFSRRPKLPISTRVVRICNPLNSNSDQFWFWQSFPATARKRSVDWTEFMGTESHGIPLEVRMKLEVNREKVGTKKPT